MSGFLQGQSFRTFPVPNYQPAIYSLSIRSPGFSLIDYLTYTFPLSPEALRKSWTAMRGTYDAPGSSIELGVHREIDTFGKSPPSFSIEGTTGWKRHQTDGYLYTGLQSVQALENFFDIYDNLNQQQLEQGVTDLYQLEFYDYFRSQYWRVEPVGEQGIMQDSSQTLFVKYRFQFDAVCKVSAPILGIVDALANVFGNPAVATAANVATGLFNFINVYTDDGFG